MPKKKADYNFVRRSIARGVGAQGGGVNDNGRNAMNNAKKSTKGHYRIAFSKLYERVSEKDVELRKKYAMDLISKEVAVPVDLITLKARKSTGEQTVTALDEVFYVKVGSITYGKISIRTQRHWKGVNLLFIFQTKGTKLQPPKKGFPGMRGYKKRTKSQVMDANNRSYRNRKEGKD